MLSSLRSLLFPSSRVMNAISAIAMGALALYLGVEPTDPELVAKVDTVVMALAGLGAAVAALRAALGGSE